MKKDVTLTLEMLVELFINKAINIQLIRERDKIYFRNQFYNLLSLDIAQLAQPLVIPPEFQINDSISLADFAEMIYLSLDGNQVCGLGETKEQAETALINIFLPAPSVIEDKVASLWHYSGVVTAMEWYYRFSQNTNYIKTADIAKNQSWKSPTIYGELEITINLSKPEKDPLEIARAKLIKPTTINYPKCLLCIENEGYAGSVSQPSRHNHRILSLTLNNKPWFFQYSPYAYYPEHSIIINPEHRDMIINRETFINLLDFVDLIPHYLIGSNSDIPIVGGSILTHDHYQAGNYVFPIEKAKIKKHYQLAILPKVEVNYLLWPVTTLQLVGNRKDLLTLTMLIIEHWYNYSNPELAINHCDEQGNRHNAITPVARKLGNDKYALYLMLRNNRTNDEHPEGIFHPHRHLHHIKKENIGLIEAMGLAILPGRLQKELAEIEKLLLLNDKAMALSQLLFDESLHKHEEWLSELYLKYGSFSECNLPQILKNEVTEKFALVLECSGVFKNNAAGDFGMDNFIQLLQ